MNKNRVVQVTYFLLRVVAGLLFFQAGSMKFLGWFGGMPGQPGSRAPLLTEIGIGGGGGVFGGGGGLVGGFFQARALPPSWGNGRPGRPGSRAQGRLAHSQPRRARRPVLLHLSVHGGTRRRRLEPRRADPAQA